MDTLPTDCLHLICRHLTNNFKDEIVRTAGYTAMVGNKTMTQLSCMLWEHLEAGCHKRSAEEHERNIKAWKAFQLTFHEKFRKLSEPIARICVSDKNKVKELSTICELLNVPKSGTKAKLLENINNAYDKLEEERIHKLEALIHKNELQPIGAYVYEAVGIDYADNKVYTKGTSVIIR